MAVKNVCVFGGTGFVGGHLANLLTGQEIRIRIPARSRERSRDLLVLPTVELIQADVYDDSTLDALLDGMDAVINLVGVIHGDFFRAHIELPRKLVAACERNGVRRLLHMSALHAGTNQPSVYLRTKGEGENIVESSALDTTVFRPSVIFGPGDSSLTRFARLGRLPVVALACPHAKFQPVFVEDVVRAFADSLDAPHTIGKSYDLCGPRCYTLREMFEYAAHVTGSDPVVIGLNDSFSYLEALVLEFLPGKLMTRDNYRSMKIDNVCDCNATQSTLQDVWGIRPIAMEEVAPGYLNEDLPRERYDDFRQRAGR